VKLQIIRRVVSFSFTGRGWGHDIGMCQYGAYGFAKMGVKYDQIIKHYYLDFGRKLLSKSL